jgi:hypothetical protein
MLSIMSLTINLEYLKDIENKNYKIDPMKFQKMLFIYNAIEDGWSLKKKDGCYIFTKKTNNKKEVIKDEYLAKFMKTNLELHDFI